MRPEYSTEPSLEPIAATGAAPAQLVVRGYQMQFNFKIFFVLISCVLLIACSETIHWQEEALLNTNQKIIVNRAVKFVPAELGKTRPANYEINAKDPFTGKNIKWKGSFGLSPIMLNFKGGYAFIVARPAMCDAKITEFSVSGFPYIFMRSYGSNKWETVNPSQFPPEFKYANLSASYNYYRIDKGNFQTSEEISKGNEETEKSSDGFFKFQYRALQNSGIIKGIKTTRVVVGNKCCNHYFI